MTNLNCKKAKELKLGHPKVYGQRQLTEELLMQIGPRLKKLQSLYITCSYALAEKLNALRVETLSSGKWNPNTVKRMLPYLA